SLPWRRVSLQSKAASPPGNQRIASSFFSPCALVWKLNHNLNVRCSSAVQVCCVRLETEGVRLRVLVIEDEVPLCRQLAASLENAGYAVDCAADGKRGDFLCHTETYDAVVLDLGLPGIDGLTLLRQWRESGLLVPVLVLTARGSWHEKVQGIDGGAD